jgi:hypothetical protein
MESGESKRDDKSEEMSTISQLDKKTPVHGPKIFTT